LHLDVAQVEQLVRAHPPARLDGVRLYSLGRIRKSRGITQRNLALEVGVRPTTVANWESGRGRVHLNTARELAKILGAELDDLTRTPAAEVEPRPLRRLRRDAGMTCVEAAAHLGIAVGTLARYESGERKVPIAILRRMARSYRCPVAQLVRMARLDLPTLPRGTRWTVEQVPQAIRALREAEGCTKADLGRAVGRSATAVAAWESGKARPTSGACRRMEVVFRLRIGMFPY
jgi:transcriptional regulator with XRE-family HTH domain